MAQKTVWVHQYTLRDLVDDTFDLFKERATSLLLAGLIPYSLIVIYVFLMRTYVIPGDFLKHYDQDSINTVLQSWQLWVFLGGLAAVNVLAFTIGHIAQCRIAVALALGEELNLLRAFRLLAKPCWSSLVFIAIYTPLSLIIFIIALLVGIMLGVLFTAMLASIGGGVGSVIGGVLSALFVLACSMLGLVLVSTYFVTVPVLLAHEHLGPFAAMGRSFRIAGTNFKSHFWALYVLLHIPTFFWPITILVTALLISIANFIHPTMNVIISSLIGNLVSVACFGLLACFETLVYLDGRCRLEALDLLMLARQVGLGAELERALRQSPAAVATQFPNYSALPAKPTTPTIPLSGESSLTPPTPTGGFPDYSAPPSVSSEVPDGA